MATAITQLKVGEALVSLLQPDGAPSPVVRTLIKPPASRVGPVTPAERQVLIGADAVGSRYDQTIDRESAEEMLAAKAGEASAAAAEREADAGAAKEAAAQAKLDARAAAAAQREAGRRVAYRQPPSTWDKVAVSAARSAGSSLARQAANEIGREVFGGRSRRSSSVAGGIGAALVRGVLGGLFRGR